MQKVPRERRCFYDVPEVSYNTSHFITDTMLAYTDRKTIYVKCDKRPTYDTFFSVAHELRHLWQIKTNKEYFFGNYKERNVLDVEAFNMQIAEIDAHAFSEVIMRVYFGVKPLHNGVSENVKLRIQEYIKEKISD